MNTISRSCYTQPGVPVVVQRKNLFTLFTIDLTYRICIFLSELYLILIFLHTKNIQEFAKTSKQYVLNTTIIWEFLFILLLRLHLEVWWIWWRVNPNIHSFVRKVYTRFRQGITSHNHVLCLHKELVKDTLSETLPRRLVNISGSLLHSSDALYKRRSLIFTVHGWEDWANLV